MDTIYTLVDFYKSLKYEDLPDDVILKAKIELVDILACVSAGTTANLSKEVAELIMEWGGKEESSVFVFDKKIPSFMAGYVNCLLAHARDYDDFQADAIVHPGISVISTALAVAEKQGNIDGKQLLTAIVAGDDLMIRMATAIKWPILESGFIYSAILGHFGSALTASLLMNLDRDQTVNALGLAYAQSAGNQQSSADTALAKRMQPAFAVRSGIFSAELAKIGVTGPYNIIDGSYSLYHVYLRDHCNKAALTEDLGKKFMIGTLSYKFYPFCGLCQGAIASTEALIEKYDIKPEEVLHIEVGTSAQGIDICALPKETKFNPKTMVDAQFSIPYCIATLLTKRKLGLASLTPSAISDPDTNAIIDKINCHVDPEIDAQYSRGVPPEEVTIETTRGKFTANEWWKGNPLREISMNDIKAKFEDAGEAAIFPMRDGIVDNIIQYIENIETVKDITSLIVLFNEAFIH